MHKQAVFFPQQPIVEQERNFLVHVLVNRIYFRITIKQASVDPVGDALCDLY